MTSTPTSSRYIRYMRSMMADLGKKTESRKTQRQRFIEAAKEAGCSDDETAFDEALRKIGRAKEVEPKGKSKPTRRG